MRGGDYGWLGALGYPAPPDFISNKMTVSGSKVHKSKITQKVITEVVCKEKAPTKTERCGKEGHVIGLVEAIPVQRTPAADLSVQGGALVPDVSGRRGPRKQKHQQKCTGASI